jgi:hypothetical protein
MTDPFSSPHQTILRAHHHINDITARINEFTATQPWSYVVEKNADHTLDLHKIKFARRLPPDLPSVVFDASNNLRAALDQTGYATARLAGKAEPKSSNFPFGDDEAGLENVIKRGKCKDLPPKSSTCLEDLNRTRVETTSFGLSISYAIQRSTARLCLSHWVSPRSLSAWARPKPLSSSMMDFGVL